MSTASIFLRDGPVPEAGRCSGWLGRCAVGTSWWQSSPGGPGLLRSVLMANVASGLACQRANTWTAELRATLQFACQGQEWTPHMLQGLPIEAKAARHAFYLRLTARVGTPAGSPAAGFILGGCLCHAGLVRAPAPGGCTQAEPPAWRPAGPAPGVLGAGVLRPAAHLHLGCGTRSHEAVASRACRETGSNSRHTASFISKTPAALVKKQVVGHLSKAVRPEQSPRGGLRPPHWSSQQLRPPPGSAPGYLPARTLPHVVCPSLPGAPWAAGALTGRWCCAGP
jgi:hypothetical protein